MRLENTYIFLAECCPNIAAGLAGLTSNICNIFAGGGGGWLSAIECNVQTIKLKVMTIMITQKLAFT